VVLLTGCEKREKRKELEKKREKSESELKEGKRSEMKRE
jgi:hypothetical protein